MDIRNPIIAVLACAPFAAFAQNESRPHPADAAAAVPSLEHRSAFSGYRPHKDEPVGRWIEVIQGLGPPWWGPGSQAEQPSKSQAFPSTLEPGRAAPKHGQQGRQGDK